MSETAVVAEVTVVYRVPGSRRFFTKHGAYNRAAWERMAAKCYCDPGTGRGDGETCHYHLDMDEYQWGHPHVIRDRLASLLRIWDEKVGDSVRLNPKMRRPHAEAVAVAVDEGLAGPLAGDRRKW